MQPVEKYKKIRSIASSDAPSARIPKSIIDGELLYILFIFNNFIMETLRIAAALAILATGLFAWWKAGFKCPVYIHIIGAIAIALGFNMAASTAPESEINNWPLLGKWWTVLIAPAFVYGGFAVYGIGVYGQKNEGENKEE